MSFRLRKSSLIFDPNDPSLYFDWLGEQSRALFDANRDGFVNSYAKMPVPPDGAFSCLPDELVYQILENLDGKSLCLLSVTCSRLRNLCDDPYLWRKRVLERRWPMTRPELYEGSWKALYMDRSAFEDASVNRLLVLTSQKRSIIVVAPDGSDIVPITTPAFSVSYQQPTWSPKGDFIAYALMQHLPRGSKYPRYPGRPPTAMRVHVCRLAYMQWRRDKEHSREPRGLHPPPQRISPPNSLSSMTSLSSTGQHAHPHHYYPSIEEEADDVFFEKAPIRSGTPVRRKRQRRGLLGMFRTRSTSSSAISSVAGTPSIGNRSLSRSSSMTSAVSTASAPASSYVSMRTHSGRAVAQQQQQTAVTRSLESAVAALSSVSTSSATSIATCADSVDEDSVQPLRLLTAYPNFLSWSVPYAPFYFMWSADCHHLLWLSNWKDNPSYIGYGGSISSGYRHAGRVVDVATGIGPRTVAKGLPIYASFLPGSTRMLAHFHQRLYLLDTPSRMASRIADLPPTCGTTLGRQETMEAYAEQHPELEEQWQADVNPWPELEPAPSFTSPHILPSGLAVIVRRDASAPDAPVQQSLVITDMKSRVVVQVATGLTKPVDPVVHQTGRWIAYSDSSRLMVARVPQFLLHDVWRTSSASTTPVASRVKSKGLGSPLAAAVADPRSPPLLHPTPPSTRRAALADAMLTPPSTRCLASFATPPPRYLALAAAAATPATTNTAATTSSQHRRAVRRVSKPPLCVQPLAVPPLTSRDVKEDEPPAISSVMDVSPAQAAHQSMSPSGWQSGARPDVHDTSRSARSGSVSGTCTSSMATATVTSGAAGNAVGAAAPLSPGRVLSVEAISTEVAPRTPRICHSTGTTVSDVSASTCDCDEPPFRAVEARSTASSQPLRAGSPDDSAAPSIHSHDSVTAGDASVDCGACSSFSASADRAAMALRRAADAAADAAAATALAAADGDGYSTGDDATTIASSLRDDDDDNGDNDNDINDDVASEMAYLTAADAPDPLTPYTLPTPMQLDGEAQVALPFEIFNLSRPVAMFWSRRGAILLFFLLETGQDNSSWLRPYTWCADRPTHPPVAYERFYPTGTFLQEYLRFSEQYNQSLTFFSPDDRQFCYACAARGVVVQVIGRPDLAPTIVVPDAEFACWSPS